MKKIYPFLLIFSLFPAFLTGQQIENPGFEQWEPIPGSLQEPVDWSTIKTADDPFIASVAPVTYEQSTDARTGNYSLKLYNVLAFGLVATGAICNGRFHAEFNIDNAYSYTDSTDAQWHTPFTARPDSLTGWFRYYPQGNDRAQFKVILHVGECKLPENGTLPNWVAMAYYKTEPGVTTDTWTRFSVPFEYYDDRNPAYLLCVMNSGDSTAAINGSYLLVDDLELIYGASGVGETAIESSFLQIFPGYFRIKLLSEKEYLHQPFRLTDMTGRTVLSIKPSGDVINLPRGIRPGTYVAVLEGDSSIYTQKVLIR